MLQIKEFELYSKELCLFYDALKIKQEEIKFDEQVYYSIVSYHAAFKYKIFFKNFMLHPIILQKKFFYESKKLLETKEEIRKCLQEVIEYELTTTNKEGLTIDERNNLIKIFKKLDPKQRKDHEQK